MPSKALATASLSFELDLWSRGINPVFGIDEAGRGAWAGSVAAAAVCFAPDPTLGSRLAGLTDSKLLSAAQREAFAGRIREIAQAWGIGSATAEEIDSMGILPATRLAMARALADAIVRYPSTAPAFLLVDHIPHPRFNYPCQTLVKGDSRSLSIAAASVLAKTWRDAQMIELGAQFPQYGFESNKGYGSKAHQRALADHGPASIHRYSYEPVQRVVASLF